MILKELSNLGGRSMKKFMLCSEGKCCPEVVVDKDIITITDDDGGQVKLTKEQVRILWDNLK
ncbi:MAG: hypothetical protein MUF59_04035 [Candidatus Krumholzibacteria bacterium]|nr:hypothetical protein [Candidatus Krumholzibacteria bacterium]